MLHVLVTVEVELPAHGFPPLLGGGLLHVLDKRKFLVPDPHVTEQSDTGTGFFQLDQPPSVATGTRINSIKLLRSEVQRRYKQNIFLNK